jgi:hypothetical protein
MPLAGQLKIGDNWKRSRSKTKGGCGVAAAARLEPWRRSGAPKYYYGRGIEKYVGQTNIRCKGD